MSLSGQWQGLEGAVAVALSITEARTEESCALLCLLCRWQLTPRRTGNLGFSCQDPWEWEEMPKLKVTSLVAVGAKGLRCWFSDQLNQSLDVFESSLDKTQNCWFNPE